VTRGRLSRGVNREVRGEFAVAAGTAVTRVRRGANFTHRAQTERHNRRDDGLLGDFQAPADHAVRATADCHTGAATAYTILRRVVEFHCGPTLVETASHQIVARRQRDTTPFFPEPMRLLILALEWKSDSHPHGCPLGGEVVPYDGAANGVRDLRSANNRRFDGREI